MIDLHLSIFLFLEQFKWYCILILVSICSLLVYKNAIDFCMVILYPEVSLTSHICFQIFSFFWQVLWFLCRQSCHLQMKAFFLPFKSECLLFPLFALLHFLNFQHCFFKYYLYIYLEHQTVIILVHLSCYNKIPQTGWLVNNRNFFLTLLEARSPRSGCQHGQILKTLLWFAESQFLTVSSHSERLRSSTLIYEGSHFTS